MDFREAVIEAREKETHNSQQSRKKGTHTGELLQTLPKQRLELGCLSRKHPSHHINTCPGGSEEIWLTLEKNTQKAKASFSLSFSKRDFLVFRLAQWLDKLHFIMDTITAGEQWPLTTFKFTVPSESLPNLWRGKRKASLTVPVARWLT